MIEAIDSLDISKSIKTLRKECKNINEVVDGRIAKIIYPIVHPMLLPLF